MRVDQKQFAPRRHRRRRLGIDASCHDGDGRLVEAELTDLSEAGCRIDFDDAAVDPGEAVVVRPQGIEALSGRVKWTHEKTAGVEFASALHPAVVDHYAGDGDLEGTPKPPRIPSGFTDNFGRQLPTLGTKRRRVEPDR